MGSIKEQMKMPLTIEMHMTISKLASIGSIDKQTALEAGAYVIARYLGNIQKINVEQDLGSLTREEITAAFENVNDFYMESFAGQIVESDFEIITTKSLELITSNNSEEIVKNYFSKIMSL